MNARQKATRTSAGKAPGARETSKRKQSSPSPTAPPTHQKVVGRGQLGLLHAKDGVRVPTLVGHAFPRRNGGGGFQGGDRRRRVYRGGKTEAGRGQCCDQGALESFGSRNHFFFVPADMDKEEQGKEERSMGWG